MSASTIDTSPSPDELNAPWKEVLLSPWVLRPEILSSPEREIIFLRLLHDLCEYGVLSEIQGCGISGELLSALPSGVRDDAKALFNLLDSRGLRKQRGQAAQAEPQTEEDWLSLAASTLASVPLYAILGMAESAGREESLNRLFLHFLSGLRTLRWAGLAETTFPLTNSRVAYQRFFRSALGYAQKVMLIDPYFNPEAAYQTTLEICLEAIGSLLLDPPPEKKIFVHADVKSQDNKRWEAFFSGATKRRFQERRVSVEFWFWEERKPRRDAKIEGKYKFHDRYLLVDQRGFSVPYGFACDEGPTQTYWSRLSASAASEIAGRFHKNTGRFDYKQQICFPR